MIGKMIAGSVEGIGNAVSEVVGTIWGSTRERETALHDEQMAVLTEFAAEFAGRPPKTWWDSFVDGLNRLPRPMITFGIIGLFVWAAWQPLTFARTMQALAVVPDELWIMMLTIIAFWFGGRFVNRDLRKPKVTEKQLEIAREIVERRVSRRRPEEDVVVPVLPDAAPPRLLRAADTRRGAEAAAEPPGSAALPELPGRDGGEGSIRRMIADLIEREGGYVDHPADRGGPTKYGVTRATLATWRDSPVSSRDVRNLERGEAEKIYRSVYYLGPRIDQLPAAIQAHVFDIGVNSGPRTAVKLLQRALGRLGERLAVDGVIGPATRAAAEAHPADRINAALVDIRLDFYDDIVAGDARQAAFIKGWRARARSFLPA